MAIRRDPGLTQRPQRARGAELKGAATTSEGDEDKPRSVEDLRKVANMRTRLRPGDEGPAIEELQRALGMEPTGIFDAAMQTRIEALQGASGLARTGVIDADTLYALNSALQTAAPRIAKLLGKDQREAIHDLDKAVDEGTGLFAHKRIAFVEFASLGVLTVRSAGEAVSKAGKAFNTLGLSKAADVVGPVLVPITALYAAKDVRAALRANRRSSGGEVNAKRAEHAANRAMGSVGYFASVSATTARELIRTSRHASGLLGKLAPGLNVIVAAGDLTWAASVCRDAESSKKKKACACVSAAGSLVSMVTPPPISWAASAVASGGLLASNFV